jgi:hypothetical protein
MRQSSPIVHGCSRQSIEVSQGLGRGEHC